MSIHTGTFTSGTSFHHDLVLPQARRNAGGQATRCLNFRVREAISSTKESAEPIRAEKHPPYQAAAGSETNLLDGLVHRYGQSIYLVINGDP